MRGKYVNLVLGILNILFGILILVFQLYVPQNIVDLTIQENSVVNLLSIIIKIILIPLTLVNIIALYNNRLEQGFKSGYKITLFTLSYFILPKFIIAIFPILGGIIVIKKIFKETLVELDSTFALSIMLIILASIIITIIACIGYKQIGQYMYKKQNKDCLEYKDNFFQYITELSTEEVYINFKVNGKYGYINQYGDVKINFDYDFASPFININVFDKNFQIALVTKDGVSKIIMKNLREVKSYISESANDDYETKINELKDFYTNTLKQNGEMQYEIEKLNNKMYKCNVYENFDEDYTYLYDFNDNYDIGINASELGQKDLYYMIKKDNRQNRIKLECDNLCYDKDYLYLYSNGDLPYYTLSSRDQGWYNSYGRKTNMNGKAQICEIVDGTLLLKDYNNNTAYFMNANKETISPKFKNIFFGNYDKYVVQNTNDKYTIINKIFEPIINEEYDFIDTSLAKYGLYICGNLPENIEISEYGYANLKMKIIDYTGNVLIDDVDQVYGSYFKEDLEIRNKEKREQKLRETITSLHYEFVGDEFYEKYK